VRSLAATAAAGAAVDAAIHTPYRQTARQLQARGYCIVRPSAVSTATPATSPVDGLAISLHFTSRVCSYRQ